MGDGYNMTVNGTDVYAGSGNVYEDLGLDDADELFAKAKLAHRINAIIEADDLIPCSLFDKLPTP